MFLRLGDNSTEEIWNKIFKKHPKRIKAVGFKLFYYHPVDSDIKDVWRYIDKDKKIKIIHLKRENILRSVLSRKIADKTQVWKEKNPDITLTTLDKTVTLSRSECEEEFRQTKNWILEANLRFKDHHVFNLNYGDLVKNRAQTLQDIFSFLNLSNYDVSTDIIKQNKESLEELISNFNSLKESFENSEWEYLLNNDLL